MLPGEKAMKRGEGNYNRGNVGGGGRNKVTWEGTGGEGTEKRGDMQHVGCGRRIREQA